MMAFCLFHGYFVTSVPWRVQLCPACSSGYTGVPSAENAIVPDPISLLHQRIAVLEAEVAELKRRLAPSDGPMSSNHQVTIHVVSPYQDQEPVL